MAITEATVEALVEVEEWIDKEIDSQTNDLTSNWATNWDRVASQWETVSSELAAEEEWPSQSAILRDHRVSLALDSTLAAIERSQETSATRVDGRIDANVDVAVRAEVAMIRASLPQGLVETVTEQSEPNQSAINSIIERSKGRVTDLMSKVSAPVYARLLDTLIAGVSGGRNPRETARRMQRNLENAYNLGLDKALTIARTETLDAMRGGQRLTDRANSDVLAGWRWSAAFDNRTCPSCIAMDGTVFSIEIPGPDDHQNGRCARLPVTRTWAELGIDAEEPPSVVPDAKEWFDTLSYDDKLQIMGPGRLDLLSSGEVGWDDIATYKPNPDWRGSYRPTPVYELRQKATA